MNYMLQYNTKYIYIYNVNNFCLYYTTNRILNGNTMTFKISEEHLGTDIVVQFLKHNSEERKEEYNDSPIDFKKKLKISHEVIYRVPDIRLYGEQTECNICLDNVDKDLRYISPCGHLFHMECIWKHIVAKKMFKKNDDCNSICHHSEEIPSNFTCPVCNNLITS